MLNRPVQPLPHGGYQAYNPSYNQPYNPAAVAYNNDQGAEEDDEQDPYFHHGYPPQYYPQQPSQFANSYHSSPTHSEDVELRSPGVTRRFSQDVIMDESEDGGL
ncbi:hypothetical protein Q5P01_011000 [Channa striata]|uniref:Uncharacterized protein n=1 Tax=Channa striata TaxID=64152 RepID=A0AA88MSE9_CHASR|nr:hypothetical protein Q5P01_011000 [Channa striata]